jgi:beta-glucosidase
MVPLRIKQKLTRRREQNMLTRLVRSGCFALSVAIILFFIATPGSTQAPKPDTSAPYLNPALPVEQRVNDLVSRMTLEEKVSQMMNSAPAIPRLGIPEYDWWNEALHGVGFSGIATVFPQAIGLGATFDASARQSNRDSDFRRGSRQVSRSAASRESKPLLRSDILVAKHKHLS